VAGDPPSVPRRSVRSVDLRDAYAMAEYLLEVHGLDDWQVSYDNAKRRAGICKFAEQTLGLSAPLTAVHTEDDVRDTILHEIAHALVGPAHGHDATWLAMARRIGSSGERCVSPDSPTPPAAWLGACPGGHTLERHRRPERVLTCGLCSSTFDLAHLYNWTHHGKPAVLHPNYEAELARLREGRHTVLLPVGARVRVTVAGEHHGTVGRVAKRGRTSYHLRAGRRLLRVPFAWVEPA
jgi:predicted SprT family Zn-dependent metalloprotease